MGGGSISPVDCRTGADASGESSRSRDVRSHRLSWLALAALQVHVDATDVNGTRVLEFPEWMVQLSRRALVESSGDPRAGDDYTPDTALVNFYDDVARMGMHQDRDERSLTPVVSLSIGDTCQFRFGNTTNRNLPYEDIALSSGDLFVFGGASRLAYHGVMKIFPGTAPPNSGLGNGRVNITMRVTGMVGPQRLLSGVRP